MSDSKPSSETDSEAADKPEKVTGDNLGPNQTPPVQYIRPPSIAPPESKPPQVITQIIKEPSFTQNLCVEVRNRLESGIKSLRTNLRADIVFCREAFKVAFSESRWSRMIAAVTHVHKLLNWFLSLGAPAGIIALYVAYIYPLAGPAGTIIIVLSLLVFASLVTIRVTRKFYEKTSASLVETQEQVGNLTAASENHARLIQAARTAMATARREIGVLEERLKPKVEITNVFWDQFEGVGEDGEPDSFQLLRLEVTSTEATWAQVTVDHVELDGYSYRKVHLHIQHKPWDTQKTELLPGRPEYWDVVQKARRSDRIELVHSEPLITARSLSSGYKILLRITVACDKGFGVSERITIERDDRDIDFRLD